MEKILRKMVEPVLTVCFLAVIIFMIATLTKTAPGNSSEEPVYLSENWYYLDGDKKVDVTFPFFMEKEDEEPLVLYNDGLTADAAGRTVSTKGAVYKMSVSLDDQVIYQYQDEAFPRNIQMASRLNCNAVLPLDTGGRTLAITFQNTNHGEFKIDEILIGKSSDIYGHHLAESAFIMAVVLLMFIFGIIALCMSIYLKNIHKLDKRMISVGIFLMVCGTWCATDSSLGQQITNLSPVTNYISFYAFMLMSVPLLHFIQETGEMSRYRVLDYLIYASYLNALIQTLVNYFYGIPMIDMLFITHIAMFLMVVTCIVLLIKEYKQNNDKELFLILRAFALMGSIGVLAILLYWMFEISFYDYIFELGILVFIGILLFHIVDTTVRSMQFETEMLVYRRLAKEDRLTGLSNRLAFDEYVKEIEGKAKTFQNLALIFMDLNGLKRVNDLYGHEAGDQLIIAASKAIRETFGEIGKCFRLGGDEFCVILPNPGKNEEEWFRTLDQSIAKYNEGQQYPLVIARGISYLRGKEGDLLTISDWKYEADQRMYKDKDRRHKEERKAGIEAGSVLKDIER